MVFTNGTSSPVFKPVPTANDNDTKNLKSFDIPNYSLVKRINGTEHNYWRNEHLMGLSFAKKDGTSITKVELAHSTFGKETQLADDEEIIGVYGSLYGSSGYFA